MSAAFVLPELQVLETELPPDVQRWASAGTLCAEGEPPTAPRIVPRPRIIVGDDDRWPVADTSRYPYSAIALLDIVRTTGEHVPATAWFIGERTLATAGHCVFAAGRRAAKIAVYAGRNGEVPGPVPPVWAASWQAHPHWERRGDDRFDFGVIQLDQPLGARVGAFGCASPANAALKNLRAGIAGYPIDRANEQWMDVNRIVGANEHLMSYAIDTIEGQSGSPVFVIGKDGYPYAVGIHTGSRTLNVGVRLTAPVVQQLAAWRQ